VKNTSLSIVADVALKGNDRGIILAQGGKFGGWALYMDGGKPTYTYNYFGLESYSVQATKAITDDNAVIKVEFKYDGEGPGKGGVATLFVNDEQVAQGRIDRTQPFLFSADETADVAKDDATQVVSTFKDSKDSQFTGYVKKVVISTGD